MAILPRAVAVKPRASFLRMDVNLPHDVAEIHWSYSLSSVYGLKYLQLHVVRAWASPIRPG